MSFWGKAKVQHPRARVRREDIRSRQAIGGARGEMRQTARLGGGGGGKQRVEEVNRALLHIVSADSGGRGFK